MRSKSKSVFAVALAFFALSASSAFAGTNGRTVTFDANYNLSTSSAKDCDDHPHHDCAARTECEACTPHSNWYMQTCRDYNCNGELVNTHTDDCTP